MTARLIMKMRVEAARVTSPGVLHLALTHPTRPVLPAWSAGAHVDLRLPDGVIRQYSLCGDPEDRSRYEIAVKRAETGRGGSIRAHGVLQPGREAHVSAPRNNFPLDGAGTRYVLVAGGIGITALLPMARTLRRWGKALTLHYCARSGAEAALLDEVTAVCGDALRLWLSRAGSRFDPALIGPHSEGAQAYLCGPHGLMDAARLALSDWPAASVHSESFHTTLDADFKAEPFDITIASTGQTLRVPADRSMLDVLRQHGFLLPSSCESGVCGSCECGYRDGVVLHRDMILPVAKRQDRLMLCVSRARVGVTLDL